MLDTMSPARVIGGRDWVGTVARIIGLWIIALFAFAAIFLGLLFSEHSRPVLVWLLIPVAVLIAPAYGWREYQAARQRNQRKVARSAKIVAIVLLVINAAILAAVWLAADGLKHMR